MNKIGIYYAYWTHNWDADFVPYCAKAAGLGFDVLEVNSGTVATMSSADRQTLKQAAADAGIELTSCIGLPKEYDIASADASVRDCGIDFLKRQAEALAETGIHELGGIIYSNWPGKMPEGETDKRPFWDRSVAGMRQAIKTAEDCGVLFHMEVVNRFEQYMMNTAAEAVQYVEEVGSPNCRILLDTFHMNIEEDGFAESVRTAGKHLGHLHLGENNRRAPGRGNLPWAEIFGATREIGFEGSIVMEPFLMPGGEIGRDISVYRDLKGDLDLDEEARRACAFVKETLRNA